METVNVHDAKTNLSKLLAKVELGEEVVIARAGKPVARLVPYVEELARRPFGLYKGQIWMSDDFDDPLPNEFWNAPVFPDEADGDDPA
jgi:prevent-host-death family protein